MNYAFHGRNGERIGEALRLSPPDFIKLYMFGCIVQMKI